MFWTTILEEIKTHFCSTSFLFENRTIYQIMLKNMVDPGRAQITIWRMRIACWITKATSTHLEYVIYIPFPVNNDFKNSSQCYVIRTLSVLFNILSSPSTHLPLFFPPKKSTFHVCSESFVAFIVIALNVLLPCIHTRI